MIEENGEFEFWDRYYRDFYILPEDGEFCEILEMFYSFLVVSDTWWFETDDGVYPISLQHFLFDVSGDWVIFEG